jgi:serine/threonine-protein kinase
MGTVYRAKDPAMDRVVALKTIIAVALGSNQGGEFRERFYREARAAGKLAHPGIVPVFDVGEHEGLPFLVMEFIDGRTLDDVAKAGERLTLDRVCEIGQQVAEAIGYAHRNGVVHRDIKPANILVTSAATYGIQRPKITDFGVAKLAAGSTTLSGQMLGTPAFMPPEQFTGAPVDGRADIFSLGVILYWLATGELPFPGETLTAVSYKVVHTEPVPPSKLNPSIPPALEGVILKCLAKSPAARYSTGDELARDLAGVRGASSGSLQRTAMRLPLPGETDATLDAHANPTGHGAPVAPALAVSAASKGAPANKSRMLPALAVVLAALLLVGWYALRSRHSVVDNQPAAALSPAAEQKAPSAPAASQAPVAAKNAGSPSQQPAGAGGQPVAGNTSTAAAPVSRAKAMEAPKEAAPADVDFDPKSMDSSANAKLKIDPPRAPETVHFTVEMNGKTYYQWSGSGNKSEYQNLFVPPGVHEFRVTGRSDDARVASNIVSTEFKAKKRKTLKIELRNPKPPSGQTAPPLSSDSQLFVTLK